MNSLGSTKTMKNNVGRPTVMTPDILDKLRYAFLIGASDEEACAYAQIGASTLYDYQKKDAVFSEQKEQWKLEPILKAKQSVVKGLSDPELALKYLERKKRDEFGLRKEFTGKDGERLMPNTYVSFEEDDPSQTSS